MKKLLFLSTLVLTLSSTVRANDQEIPFIGIDEAGKEIHIPMKRRIWNEKTKEVLKRLGGETLLGLNNTVQTSEKFAFYQVDLGTHVKMKVGIGELVEASIEPWFYLGFKK